MPRSSITFTTSVEETGHLGEVPKEPHSVEETGHSDEVPKEPHSVEETELADVGTTASPMVAETRSAWESMAADCSGSLDSGQCLTEFAMEKWVTYQAGWAT